MLPGCSVGWIVLLLASKSVSLVVLRVGLVLAAGGGTRQPSVLSRGALPRGFFGSCVLLFFRLLLGLVVIQATIFRARYRSALGMVGDQNDRLRSERHREFRQLTHGAR